MGVAESNFPSFFFYFLYFKSIKNLGCIHHLSSNNLILLPFHNDAIKKTFIITGKFF